MSTTERKRIAQQCIDEIREAWTGDCDDDRYAIQLIEARFGLKPSVSPTPHPNPKYHERLKSLRGAT